MRRKLISQADRIAEGISLGHKRADIPSKMLALFVNESPFVIVYDPETCIVLRIVDGRRDLGRLLALR